jgi:transposase
MNSTTTIAVDLAKNVFQIAVSRRPGKVTESHRLTRTQFLRFFAKRRSALVLLEACGTAHFWGRHLQALGHRVRLLPPHAVRPYVHRNKTDRADAEALLEAHRNEQIHSVPVKSVAQQTLAALHRLRSAWMSDRIARINLVRGLLRELGLPIPVGARHVVMRTLELLEELPEPLRPALAEACQEISGFEQRIAEVELQLRALARQTPVVKRLQSIPGVGLLSSTALVALVGDIQRFPTSRHFASYLGLTPREHSSAQRRRLGAINKAGDCYLRSLLVTGARSVLIATQRSKLKEPDRLRRWALQVLALRGHNRAAVALANKLARIVWAVWRHDSSFQSLPVAA